MGYTPELCILCGQTGHELDWFDHNMSNWNIHDLRCKHVCIHCAQRIQDETDCTWEEFVNKLERKAKKHKMGKDFANMIDYEMDFDVALGANAEAAEVIEKANQAWQAFLEANRELKRILVRKMRGDIPLLTPEEMATLSIRYNEDS